MPNKNLVTELNRASVELYADKAPRFHLGPSVVSAKCVRQAWYAFRWAKHVEHTGRMYRLFRRGHWEEPRIVALLEAVGAEVRPYAQRLFYHEGSDSYTALDWGEVPNVPDLDDVTDVPMYREAAAAQGIKLKQWRFTDVGGHVAGSCDGMVVFPKGFAGLPDNNPGILECKTHNTGSFSKLKEKGLVKSKPEHYVQIVMYMHYFGLKWGLYFAVNKNDDDIYTEVVTYKDEVGNFYVDRARKLSLALAPPPKLTEDASYWECKFCDFREVCHKGEAPGRNCRTCAMSRPEEDGTWYCTHWNATIPEHAQPAGCDHWSSLL